jgi:hypothetical protein
MILESIQRGDFITSQLGMSLNGNKRRSFRLGTNFPACQTYGRSFALLISLDNGTVMRARTTSGSALLTA